MKTREQIIDGIYKVLSLKMSNPYLSGFHSDARLREDLALDSSATLQLLVFLELDYGLVLPEAALMNKELDTVRAVARLLYDAQPRPNPGKLLEYEEDIKLHCFVSCLSEVVKRHAQLDHRVLYFGVWDSEIVVNARCELSYHSATISHQHFVDWYARLYGVEAHAWYDARLTKEQNVEHLVSLVENRAEDQHIMVMLDLYLLPERVNEFNKDPFPHYLMLGPTPNPDDWMIYDPDYRWEGVARKERILAAVRRPTVAGGYVLSEKGISAPKPKQIRSYFEACMLPENLMTSAIREVLTAHLRGTDRNGDDLPLSHLTLALDEIPILSIRKYAYEHGFAFFWRELGLAESEFDYWCEVIDELAKTYKAIQFQSMKLAATGNRALSPTIFELLDQQDQREALIKGRMQEVHQKWWTQVGSAPSYQTTAGAAS